MVKHTQTIRRQWPTNYLSVFDHFVGLGLKAVKSLTIFSKKSNTQVLQGSKYALNTLTWILGFPKLPNTYSILKTNKSNLLKISNKKQLKLKIKTTNKPPGNIFMVSLVSTLNNFL